MSKPQNPFENPHEDNGQAWSNSADGQDKWQGWESEFSTRQFQENQDAPRYAVPPQQTQNWSQMPPQNGVFTGNTGNSGNKSTGLIVGGIVAVVAVVIAAGAGLFLFSARDSESEQTSAQTNSAQQASESAGGAAPESATEEAPATQTVTQTQTATETATESATATKTQEPSPGEEFADLSGRAFAQRAFLMDRSDLDPKGWVGSSARCGSGDYARVVAETTEGRAVICENSYNRQKQYYLGDFGPTPSPYPVTDVSGSTVTATNMQYEYVLSPSKLVVYEDGEVIFDNDVVDWGTLQAG